MATRTKKHVTPSFEELRGLPTPSFEEMRKTPSFEVMRRTPSFESLRTRISSEEREVQKRTEYRTKFRPLSLFGRAFSQSLAAKPAMALRGAQVYTPGEALGFDAVMEKTSDYLESLHDVEKKSQVAMAAEGKMWPTEEGTLWYKIKPSLLPETINTWAATVGDQIPIMLMTLVGKLAGTIVGVPAGAVAGVAAGLITAGPDPTDIVTVPAIAATTTKIFAHLGGAAPLVAMEAGGFLDRADELGIDEDITEKYARLYGLGSGAIEYAQWMWNLKAFSRLGSATKKTILKKVLLEIGGAAWEGFEELSQTGLENKLIGKAIQEQKLRHPEYKEEKPKIFAGGKRAFSMGLGVSLITRLPGHAFNATRKAKMVKQVQKQTGATKDEAKTAVEAISEGGVTAEETKEVIKKQLDSDELHRIRFEAEKVKRKEKKLVTETITKPVETRSPSKIFADRILEGVKVHETDIKAAQKKERARRAPLIAAERDRLKKVGVPRHEAIQQAFEKFGKGKLTDRQVFDPLWDKVDSEALFKELDSLDYKIYDQKSAFNAVKSVLDGNAPTEGQAKLLGDIYGFEVRSALDQRIASNKALNAIEKLREGKPLTLEEVSLIGRYYPNLAKLAWDAVPRMDKFIPYLKQIWFLRRTLKLGSDISLWMRQAKAEVLLHPIIATRAMIRSFKAYGIPFMENSRNKAENFTRQSVKMTKDMPHYEEAKAASINAYELPPMGVPIIEAEGLEWYKGGEMAERLPFIGHFVRAGQRAWIAGSNYFHMAKYAHDRQIFEDKEGNVTEKQARQLAAQVNTQLGRTHLPKSGLTTTAQNVMLAPGFAASRFTNFVLPLRPLVQHDMDAVKLSYLSTKAWAAFIGSNLILLSALKWMFGDEAEIDDDPTSNNFGKWRIGNTRGDVWAGFAQPARLSIQLFMATKGIKRTTSAGRKRKVEAKDLIAKFGRSKSSFLVGGIVDAFTGQTYTGKPFPPKTRKEQLGMTLEAFTPMWIMDMVDAMVQDGVAMGMVAGGGSFLGEGFASYEEAKGVTLQKYEDEVAIKKYEKPYESLTPREQFTLYEQYPDLKLLKMESESKRENIPNLNRMVKKQRAVGDRILKSLPKDVSDSLISVGLKSNRLGLSRSWQRRKKSFYLNDDRYEWYEKRVIEKLNRPGTLKRLRRIEQTYVPLRKEKEFMRRIDMIKEEARNELGLLMSRRKI